MPKKRRCYECICKKKYLGQKSHVWPSWHPMLKKAQETCSHSNAILCKLSLKSATHKSRKLSRISRQPLQNFWGALLANDGQVVPQRQCRELWQLGSFGGSRRAFESRSSWYGSFVTLEFRRRSRSNGHSLWYVCVLNIISYNYLTMFLSRSFSV